MGIYSDVALVMNSKGMECLNAQLEKLDRDVLEFLDWAESASEWLLCWRDIKWYGDDTIDVPEAYYRFRRVEETGDSEYYGELCGEFNVIAVHRLQMYSLRPPVITSEDVAQAEEFLLDNSTRIIRNSFNN